MHKYIDAFVQKMREIGDSKNGIELKTVSVLVEMDCLAMDHGPGSPRPMADSPIPGHYDASTGVVSTIYTHSLHTFSAAH